MGLLWWIRENRAMPGTWKWLERATGLDRGTSLIPLIAHRMALYLPSEHFFPGSK